MNQINRMLWLTAVPAFVVGAGTTTIYFATRVQPTDQQFWTFVGSVGTCAGTVMAAVGVLVAALSFGATVQQSRLSLGADMVLKLDDSFKTPAMKSARARAAQKLAAGALTSDENVDVVLDFFEKVGLFERRGVIDAELAWHTFYYWIIHYYHLSKSYRDYARQGDDSLWEDIDRLYERVMTAQDKMRPSRASCLIACKWKRMTSTSNRVPTPDELARFVHEETALVSGGAQG